MLKAFFPVLTAAIFIGSCGKDSRVNEEQPPASGEIVSNVITEQLNFPWELVWDSDNRIWMTERGGRISRVEPESGNVIEVATITEVSSQGEGGMLGMALHPDFNTNPYVYVAYDYVDGSQYKGKVVRFTFNGSGLSDPNVLIDNFQAAGIHNGCRLLIVNDKLFITMGDASDQSLPQNLSSKNGKILRINLDGSIPSDNPIAGSAIWSVGHRNPQGLVVVRDSIYSSEHGPDSDDEINVIHRAANYGWPNVKGECDGSEQGFCDANKVVEPIRSWTPTLAVSGIDFYTSDAIPQWKNSLLVCTLKASRLLQLKLSDGAATQITASNEFFTNTYGRLRDLCISPAGKVYFCTSNGNNDKIVEVTVK